MNCKSFFQYETIYLLHLIFLNLFAMNATFSTQYYGNTKHAELPQHCYYEDLNLTVAMNQVLRPTDIEYFCAELSCREDYVLVIKHCDRILLHHGCTETIAEYSKPYPDCCPKNICL